MFEMSSAMLTPKFVETMLKVSIILMCSVLSLFLLMNIADRITQPPGAGSLGALNGGGTHE